jgi:hypothetical protein
MEWTHPGASCAKQLFAAAAEKNHTARSVVSLMTRFTPCYQDILYTRAKGARRQEWLYYR